MSMISLVKVVFMLEGMTEFFEV